MNQYRYSIADLEVLESKKTHISNWIFLCLVFILNGNGYPEASSTAAEGDPLTSRNCRINRNTFTDKAARPSDLKSEPDEEADRNDYECGWEHIFSERPRLPAPTSGVTPACERSEPAGGMTAGRCSVHRMVELSRCAAL